MKILLATGNRKKAAEMVAILSAGAKGLEFATLADFSGLPPVVEDGRSFLENARKKAWAGVSATGLPTIGEDSGLEVEALDGAPGIFSARYADEGSDEANWRKLLRELEGVRPGKRAARFVCTAALLFPDGREVDVEGRVSGEIALAPRGTGGFGYDPVFLLPDGRMMAELTAAEKETVSHRGEALRKLGEKLRDLVGR